MMLLVKLLKGSTFSARPAGENRGQGFLSITSCSRESCVTRCAIACSSNVPVVAAGRGSPVFEGEASSIWEGYAVTEEP